MSRLLVISHTPHYRRIDGSIVGWGATVRELDYLAEAFGEVEHLAPLHLDPAPQFALPYRSAHVHLNPQKPAGGENIRAKFQIILNCPSYLRAIQEAIVKADVIQVRCPCNLAIVALCYLAIQKTPPRWAKYAGNWMEEEPPLSYRFQRWFLGRGGHHGPVTINGQWSGQPAHVFSFYNPCLTSSEIQQARAIAKVKVLQEPIRLLFVGRVEAAKGIGRTLTMLAGLRRAGLVCQLDVIGDGPERERFEKKACQLRIDDATKFHGWIPREVLADFYSPAHFLILPTVASEGFPKVLSEAMAYGVVPIAGAVSSIPQTLGEKGAGVALSSDDMGAFIETILSFAKEPARWLKAVAAGLQAVGCFTYEHYLIELDQMFRQVWGKSPISVLPKALSTA